MSRLRPAIWLPALLGWLICSGVAWLVAEWHSDRVEREAEAAAFARAEVGAEAIEQNLLRMLEATEGLHDLAQSRQRLMEMGNLSGAEALQAQLATVARTGRFGVLQVGIIGADGWLEWSSVQDWRPVYLGDREHFRVHQNGNRELFVSAPLVGRASGQWSIQITRPLWNLAGAFAGVAVVSVDPVDLSHDLARLEFGDRGTSLVLRKDGAILARSWEAENVLGQTLAPHRRFMTALAEAPAGRITVPKSMFDGRPKLVGYRVVEGTPIVATVALDAIRELTPTAFVRPALRAAAAAISLLTLAITALALIWVERRRTQASLELARRERESALERLAHAQQMEALGSLAGGVAHDFNNIMQAVLGGAKLIERRPADAKAVERLTRMITEAAERGASITRRLLAFARRGELRAEVIDVTALLAGLDEVLSHTLGADVRVKIQTGPDLPKVLADGAQLETALVNLAVNARDAMALGGGGVLTITADPEEVLPSSRHAAGLASGAFVRLSVADTGPGMDAATLARAVEPFFTTKPKGQGTGLGLAMAKGFAEQSGGRLKVASQPGQGATVTLWLPQAAAESREEGAPHRRPSVLPDRRVRVLLVDDEPHVRAVLSEALRELGHVVEEASVGDMALDCLATFHVDVLVTDLAMPGMSGIELIRRARRLKPRLPALLVTGYAGDVSLEQIAAEAELGPLMLLRKPIDPDELGDRIAALIHSDARM
jgi:signal transduction histidine kinase/ActR/RegA family two-component response regulator